MGGKIEGARVQILDRDYLASPRLMFACVRDSNPSEGGKNSRVPNMLMVPSETSPVSHRIDDTAW